MKRPTPFQLRVLRHLAAHADCYIKDRYEYSMRDRLARRPAGFMRCIRFDTMAAMIESGWLADRGCDDYFLTDAGRAAINI